MEKKFKFPVAYKAKSAEEQEELIKELESLGYIHKSFINFDHFEYIMNYKNNSYEVYTEDKNTASQKNRYLCDSRELFIALASQVDSEEFFESEYIMCIKGHGSQYTKDKMYQLKDSTTTVLDDLGSTINGFNDEGMKMRFRKATKEEIINYFNSQKKVETIKEEKQMNKKSVSVEGNKYLLQALVNELLEAGLEITNEDCSSLNLPTNLSTENNILWWSSSKKDIHYILPQDYEAAKQAFLDYYKEDKFEVGKWYKREHTDKLFIFSDYGNYKNTGFGGNGDWKEKGIGCPTDSKVIPATEEEVKAALLTYAKKKYPVGTKVKSLAMSFEGTVSHKIKNTFSTSELWFESQDGNYNYKVYEDGKWAEILPSYPDITINGYKAVFKDNFVSFNNDCAVFHKNVFQKIVLLDEFLTTSDYTNRQVTSIKLGKGEFTLAQCKEIAEYFKNK